MNSKLLLSAGLLLAIGCQQRMFNKDSGTASREANIRDVKATHCEIFIDKAFMDEQRPRENTLNQALHLFVKIDPTKLDGSVKRVSYFNKRVHEHKYGQDTRDWEEQELSRFANSSDYFEIKLELIGKDPNYSNSYSYEGAFFVQTDKGTRYWANADSSPNYRTINGNWILSMNNLKGGALTELPVLTSAPEVGSVKKTRDNGGIGRFFNPQGCE